MHSSKLEDIFYKIEALSFGHGEKGKIDKIAAKNLVETLLGGVESYYPDGKINWAELFYHRLEAQKTLIPAYKPIIWREVLQYYINHCCKRNSKSPKYRILNSFFYYLETHVVDLSNSLVGLRVRENIIQTYYTLEADGKFVPKKEGTEVDEIIDCKKKPPEKLSPGELVIWFAPGTTLFIRIAEVIDETSIAVYVDPHERNYCVVPYNEILPLHNDVLNFIGSPKLMQKMVFDSLDDFFTQTIGNVKSMLLNFLQMNGLNIEFLQSIVMNSDGINQQVSIFDLVEVNQIKTQLQDWNDNQPLAFYEEIDEFCSNELIEFVNRTNNRFFIPTQEQSFSNLKKFRYHTIARNRLRRYLSNCNTVSEFLSLEKKLILNGTTKNELMSWWLNHIDTSCHKFLCNLGYDDEAVPENYIDAPPDRNIVAVKQNLRILTKVLDPSIDVYNVLPFIKQVKDEVYVKIQEFEAKAVIILSEFFGVEPSKFDLKHAKEIHKQSMANDNNITMKWIDDLMKDIEYLRKMKEMENENKEHRGGKVKLSDVVPISGLILSSFFRKENEAKTVLELWVNSLNTNINDEMNANEIKCKNRSHRNSYYEKKTNRNTNTFVNSLRGTLRNIRSQSMLEYLDDNEDLPSNNPIIKSEDNSNEKINRNRKSCNLSNLEAEKSKTKWNAFGANYKKNKPVQLILQSHRINSM